MMCVLMSELTACLATAPPIKLVLRRPLGICDVIRTECGYSILTGPFVPRDQNTRF